MSLKTGLTKLPTALSKPEIKALSCFDVRNAFNAASIFLCCNKSDCLAPPISITLLNLSMITWKSFWYCSALSSVLSKSTSEAFKASNCSAYFSIKSVCIPLTAFLTVEPKKKAVIGVFIKLRNAEVTLKAPSVKGVVSSPKIASIAFSPDISAVSFRMRLIRFAPVSWYRSLPPCSPKYSLKWFACPLSVLYMPPLASVLKPATPRASNVSIGPLVLPSAPTNMVTLKLGLPASTASKYAA